MLANEAKQVIRDKGKELTEQTAKDFVAPEVKILAKWRTGLDHGTKAKNLIAFLNTPPPLPDLWNQQDEETLQSLKNLDIPLKETAMGEAVTKNAKSVLNHLNLLDDNTRSELQRALDGESGSGESGSGESGSGESGSGESGEAEAV